MLALLHSVQSLDKQFKIMLLSCPQRILAEERNDPFPEITDGTHAEAIQRLLVVVVPMVDVDAAAAEELLKDLESGQAFGSLGHNELREHLPAKFHHSAVLNRDGEAPFSIDEANNPSDCS